MENYRGKRRFSGLYFFNAMNHRINLTVRSFDELYEQKLTKNSPQAAYNAAEEEHEKLTGHRRYSSSESYRVARSRRFKKM